MMPDPDNNTPISLHGIASNVQKKLLADLGEASPIQHSGTKGNNTERVWIDLFAKYLPNRFRVNSAIIIDSKGEVSKQIDCVIFDGHVTPQIIPNDTSLYVPAEAVYAIFEVKQNLNRNHLLDAAKKVKSVRKLHRTSIPYTGDGKRKGPKKLFKILGGLLCTTISLTKGFDSHSLRKNLRDLDHDLDFIFAANTGYIDIVKDSLNSGETAISHGLFRLVEELTTQGTVPAVDWSAYYGNLSQV